VLGGLIGNRIGAALDDEDKQWATRRSGILAQPRFRPLRHRCPRPNLSAGRPRLPVLYAHHLY
jgi:hypothetical protein